MEEQEQLTVEQIFDRVMELRGVNKKQFAAYLEVDGSVMSSKLGAKWNLHWRIFMKLLPDLVELKIITREHLGPTSDNDGEPKNKKIESNKLKSMTELARSSLPLILFMSPLEWDSLTLQ